MKTKKINKNENATYKKTHSLSRDTLIDRFKKNWMHKTVTHAEQSNEIENWRHRQRNYSEIAPKLLPDPQTNSKTNFWLLDFGARERELNGEPRRNCSSSCSKKLNQNQADSASVRTGRNTVGPFATKRTRNYWRLSATATLTWICDWKWASNSI